MRLGAGYKLRTSMTVRKEAKNVTSIMTPLCQERITRLLSGGVGVPSDRLEFELDPCIEALLLRVPIRLVSWRWLDAMVDARSGSELVVVTPDVRGTCDQLISGRLSWSSVAAPVA